MSHKTVMSLSAIMILAAFASSGCSSPVDRSAAAKESESPTEQGSVTTSKSTPEIGSSPQPERLESL